MSKGTTKKEMEYQFRFTLEQLKVRMRDCIRRGDTETARSVAHEMIGAAEFARRLDLLSWEAMDSIREEAVFAAEHGAEGGDDETSAC